MSSGFRDAFRSETTAGAGSAATAEVEPEFTGGPDWYAGYGQRHDATDGVEARLVSMHTFSGPWDVWEMHPLGAEVVLCTAGEMMLHQEHVDGEATGVFITAGMDTRHRPR